VDNFFHFSHPPSKSSKIKGLITLFFRVKTKKKIKRMIFDHIYGGEDKPPPSTIGNRHTDVYCVGQTNLGTEDNLNKNGYGKAS